MTELVTPTPDQIEAREVVESLGIPQEGVSEKDMSRIRHHKRAGNSLAASVAKVIAEETESIAKGLPQRDLSHRRLAELGPLALGFMRTFVLSFYQTPAQSLITGEEVVRTGRSVISEEERRVLDIMNRQLNDYPDVDKIQQNLGRALVETNDPEQFVDVATERMIEFNKNNGGHHFLNLIAEELLKSGRDRFHQLYQAAQQSNN